MTKAAMGILLSISTMIVGQTVDPISPVAGIVLQYGALGILGVVVFALLKWTIPDLLRVNKDLADRWDGWEKVRHIDSEVLNETLRKVVANCATIQGKKE